MRGKILGSQYLAEELPLYKALLEALDSVWSLGDPGRLNAVTFVESQASLLSEYLHGKKPSTKRCPLKGGNHGVNSAKRKM